MKLQKNLPRILDGLILLVFILFFSSAGFQDRNTSGWYQQWFPNLNGSTIKDITFLDSLTGFAVTNSTDSLQEYILRTTNGGDNWEINYTSSNTWGFIRVISTNSNTVFAVRSYTEILKTTNRGNNWQIIPLNIFCYDISILNNDTMLAANSSSFDGGIYRSTNGGYNWQYIWTNGTSGNPSKIYMFDRNMGYIQDQNFNYDMRRTTNGGFNWISVTGEKFTSIKFLDNNTGWKVTDSVKKTTNSGISWLAQQTPRLNVDLGNYTDFSILNKDTIWMVGARSFVFKAPIYKTTNGGANWGYQIPDPNMQIFTFSNIQFVNSKTGWVLPTNLNIHLLHTTLGGNDTTIFTSINNNNSTLLSDYQLYQNYPNPFNSRTVVSCQLLVVSNLSIKVYDVQGHEVQTLVQGKLNPGVYEYIFNGNNLSSGIYFYSMIIDGKAVDTKRMIMVK